MMNKYVWKDTAYYALFTHVLIIFSPQMRVLLRGGAVDTEGGVAVPAEALQVRHDGAGEGGDEEEQERQVRDDQREAGEHSTDGR